MVLKVFLKSWFFGPLFSSEQVSIETIEHPPLKIILYLVVFYFVVVLAENFKHSL